MNEHEKSLQELFFRFYKAQTETELEPELEKAEKDFNLGWIPYGNNESYFGVIENQQASPIPALVEKITNSIDAILMKRCHEEGINPKSNDAPESIEEAIKRFFPASSSWDLSGKRSIQSEDIQIIADGPRKDTSLIIYDNGEGQHPKNFKDTFLSLLSGNKNEIRFVQGKYNMGGAGAVVFCGKKRFQLIASKRFDGKSKFGFTILRKHQLTESEQQTKKNTWYEYLVVDEEIPAFNIEALDLGLYNREFTTGSIIKLYSYQLPTGARSVISRDLNQSINEYLFEPALPIYTIDNKQRYPDDRNLTRDLYGLKRRMEADGNKYIKQRFSQEHQSSEIGSFKTTVYIFTSRLPDKSTKETRETIKREFFKNNMSVIFSLNGQVHGHYTSEFITRSLKFNLLKDHLLIHVDCTNLKLDFRNELFMASRDRLKNGEEAFELRQQLSGILSRGQLKQIYSEWKESLTAQAESGNELLQDFSKNLPLDSELRKLLDQTLNLKERKGNNLDKKNKFRESKKPDDKTAFNPQRYPSYFKVDLKSKNDAIPVTTIPIEGDKTISFSTDVEDQYFDRVEDPGELIISVLKSSDNEQEGGDSLGVPKDIDKLFHVSKASPSKGKIRVNLKPTDELSIGDSVEIKVSLTSPEGDKDQLFVVKISDKQHQNPKNVKKKPEPESIGLPKLQEVFKAPMDGKKSWRDLENIADFGHASVMYPLVEGDKLDTIFINMDSRILKSYKSTLKTEEQIKTADRRYISAVYFHTIFLYTITKNKHYIIKRMGKNPDGVNEDIDLADYLVDLFNNYYSEFLLNFEMSALMDALNE